MSPGWEDSVASLGIAVSKQFDIRRLLLLGNDGTTLNAIDLNRQNLKAVLCGDSHHGWNTLSSTCGVGEQFFFRLQGRFLYDSEQHQITLPYPGPGPSVYSLQRSGG